MSNKRSRRQLTGEQKAAIVKRQLVDQVPVSDLCEEYKILPNQFYQWQRQRFENGASAFERKKATPGLTEKRGLAASKAMSADKNEVNAKLMNENVKVKKFEEF